MAEPRKVFRIEQTAAARLEEAVETTQAGLRHAEIMRELRALRTALAAVAPRHARASAAPEPGEADRLRCELNLIAGAIKRRRLRRRRRADGRSFARTDAPMSRIDHELNAVVNGTEQATQKILAAAEEIDSAANNLSAALDGKLEQGLAQDIQDLVIQIFEACNFQDLIGQRVAKVLAALKFRRGSHRARARGDQDRLGRARRRAICTARGSTATAATPRRTTSTPCSPAGGNADAKL